MNSTITSWLGDVLSHPDLSGALVIAAKTAIIYIFLIVGLRLLGKRELGQLSVYDLVLIIVIANSVQNAMVGKDTSLGGGLVAALTLLVLNRVLTWLILAHPAIKEWMVGDPVLLVRDGRLIDSALRQQGITREHVLAAMREHGIGDLRDVQMAVLEADGAISIVAKEAKVQRTRQRFRGMHVQ